MTEDEYVHLHRLVNIRTGAAIVATEIALAPPKQKRLLQHAARLLVKCINLDEKRELITEVDDGENEHPDVQDGREKS